MKKLDMTPFTAVIYLFLGLAYAVFVPSALAADGPAAELSQLRINEILASNTVVNADPQGEFDDWIEIYNAGDASVDLAGMYLTDDPAEPTKWRFPSSTATVIPSKGYLIIWADEDVSDVGLHASFRLGASGDQVHLYAADGETLIDRMVFDQQTVNVSFGRYPDANDTLRFFSQPTPGRANNEGYLGEVAPLQFSHARGFYDAPFDLTIATATADAEILYTMDGRVPDDTGYRFRPGRTYTGPLHIIRTTCLRAMAIKPGWKPTEIHARTYVFDARPQVTSLPVISLVGDPAKVFYEAKGVMAIVGGTYVGGVWTPTGADSYNNVLNRDLERQVCAEWILPDNSEGFHIDCGLRVHGSPWIRPRYVRQNGLWSGDGKFSLRLYFRGQYGDDRLEYPLFPLSNTEEFATIVLRAGHNDRVNPFIKDELLRRLHRDMGQVSCAGMFASLFINGEYKGYYNPTEHVKAESCQQWFDSDKPWDVMTMSGIRDGDAQSWNAMVSYARTHNLADAGFYAEMCKKIDVVSFIDYLIIRLWPNDWDWPQNNWSAACERSAAGRWKFFVWDAEGTFETNQLQLDRFGELNSQSNENAVLYRALKANKDFRLLFADRLYKHFYNGGALTAGNIQRRFFEMRDVLKGVIPSMNMYILNTWVPQRLPIFMSACLREGMYTFDGPAFTVNGAAQHGGHVPAEGLLLFVPSRQGEVYYTLDGTDPAQPAAPPQPVGTALVAADSPKRVLVPASSNIGDWRGLRPFGDSTWTLSSGAPGGIGFERSVGYQGYLTTDVGPQMYNINPSCYIRIPFSFTGDKSQMKTMTLRMRYDDGFVAYLNSLEIARRNCEGVPAWNSAASADHPDAEALVFEPIDVSQHIDKLRQGNNILAIQGLNVSGADSDFLIAVELYVSPETTPAAPVGPALFAEPIRLTRSTQVKARVRSGNTWSALAEATFAVGPVAESLRVSEIMYNPADPNTEYIELTNVGAEAIDLNLVRFTDGVDFVFPATRLDPGGYCLVVEDTQAFQAKYGATLSCVGEYTGKLNNAGERIELRDAAGGPIQAVTFGDDWYDVTDGGGFSLTVRDPVTADANALEGAGAWRPSAAAGGSPGFDDGADAAEPGGVVINELLANGTGAIDDWIELHNTADQAVNIGGWYLSDDADDPCKYEIATGTTLAPHDYLVLTEAGHFGNVDDPGCHSPFALSRDGETLCLYSASAGMLTGYSDRAEFGASEAGVTFGRCELSTGAVDFVRMVEPTPGGPNAGPQIGPIVINEVMYHPDNPDDAEYVELLNISDSDVTLYDAAAGAPWRLADDPESPGVEILFPEDPPITLAPRQYLLVVKDLLLCQGRYSIPDATPVLAWGSGRLNNAGETIFLYRPGELDDDGVPQWICVDRVTFSDGSHPQDFPDGVDPWPAQADGQGSSLTRIFFGRYGNDPNNWQAEDPTPGTARRVPGR